MGRSRDVIVIGAGIIGCSVGRELAWRGASVRIFESRSVGAGATRASAGVLAPYIEAHDRGPLFTLMVRSLAMYDGFVEAVTNDSDVAIEYRRCGTLEVAIDRAAAERLGHTGAGQHDPPAGEWLNASALRLEEPALLDSAEGARYVAEHGYVAVPALTDALTWAAVRHGVQLETAHRVTGIRPDGPRLSVLTDDGSEWSAAHVVIAAGSWSAQIATAGMPPIAVRPIRGQLLRLEWQGRPLSHIIWGPDCYVVPWVNGTVLVGATVEDVGFDERATAAGVGRLLAALSELLPEASRATFLDVRVGLRPATADGLPFIGQSDRLPGVVYATGHYRNGILLAPLTAQVVADLILEGREDPILAALKPGR